MIIELVYYVKSSLVGNRIVKRVRLHQAEWLLPITSELEKSRQVPLDRKAATLF